MEKICTNYVSDKELVLRMYKELLQIIQFSKWVKDLNTYCSKENNTNDQQANEKMLNIIC